MTCGLGWATRCSLWVATPSSTGVRPRIERFILVGTFELRAEPDAGLVVARRADVVDRGLVGAGLDGWRLQLDDPLKAPLLAERIGAVLGPDVAVRFWTDEYGELFRAVRIEKAIMFALLALIVAVASLNIVSGQAMLVNDKRGDVAMLATMGASRRLLVGVFFLQGFGVAFLGVAAGLAIGMVVAANANAVVSFFEGLVGASVDRGNLLRTDPLPARLVGRAGDRRCFPGTQSGRGIATGLQGGGGESGGGAARHLGVPSNEASVPPVVAFVAGSTRFGMRRARR